MDIVLRDRAKLVPNGLTYKLYGVSEVNGKAYYKYIREMTAKETAREFPSAYRRLKKEIVDVVNLRPRIFKAGPGYDNGEQAARWVNMLEVLEELLLNGDKFKKEIVELLKRVGELASVIG